MIECVCFDCLRCVCMCGLEGRDVLVCVRACKIEMMN